MIGWVIWAKNVDRNVNKWKRPPKSSKNKMFVFVLLSTSDDRPSNLSKKRQPKCTKNEKGPLSHQKIKCSFLGYVQLLMTGGAGQWTQTLSATPLQPKKLNARFWIMFNFWWSARLVDGLEPHTKNCHPSPAKKMKCSFLDYVQLLMIGRGIWAKNINRNVKKQKRPPKSSKNKMLIFGLRSTSDVRPSDPRKNCQPKCKKTKKAP